MGVRIRTPYSRKPEQEKEPVQEETSPKKKASQRRVTESSDENTAS